MRRCSILLKPNIQRIDDSASSAQLWYQEIIKHAHITDTIDSNSVSLFLVRLISTNTSHVHTRWTTLHCAIVATKRHYLTDRMSLSWLVYSHCALIKTCLFLALFPWTALYNNVVKKGYSGVKTSPTPFVWKMITYLLLKLDKNIFILDHFLWFSLNITYGIIFFPWTNTVVYFINQ